MNLPATLAKTSLTPINAYCGICHRILMSAAWYTVFPEYNHTYTNIYNVFTYVVFYYHEYCKGVFYCKSYSCYTCYTTYNTYFNWMPFMLAAVFYCILTYLCTGNECVPCYLSNSNVAASFLGHQPYKLTVLQKPYLQAVYDRNFLHLQLTQKHYFVLLRLVYSTHQNFDTNLWVSAFWEKGANQWRPTSGR